MPILSTRTFAAKLLVLISVDSELHPLRLRLIVNIHTVAWVLVASFKRQLPRPMLPCRLSKSLSTNGAVISWK